MMRLYERSVLFLLLMSFAASTSAAPGGGVPSGAPKGARTVEQALVEAGANRAELAAALHRAPAAQREGLRFLLANMPLVDLKKLSASFLLEDLALAYGALEKAPWKDQIPKERFLNDILPYACLNETRDRSRKRLFLLAAPLIADCRTPGEAAQRLNAKLFPLLNVRYNTGRKRPDQCPTETIESGKATCTGLSILLVDACRAVGIPARVAGTPMWTNMRGNHTWVEIWDDGWHFTGAAEPDPQGLDRGWFAHDASLARKEILQHAIYASSFKRTGTHFPLDWAPDLTWVYAENVTDRYTPKAPPEESGRASVSVKVLDRSGKRVVAHVTLSAVGGGQSMREGFSRGETADLNDLLTFDLARVCPPQRYELTVVYQGKTARRSIQAGAKAQEIVVVQAP